jgi:PBSX family phage terminase large subunit
MNNTRNVIKFVPFSKKQKQVLTWWVEGSPVKDKSAIICDGAVRSGKTRSMSLSYILWSMTEFNGYAFGLAGKTIASFRRNVWTDLQPTLRKRGFRITKVPDMHDAYFISKNGVKNTYYIFGGHDEQSQTIVQGVTLAGFFFDEVALMPQSFVNQAVARCSIDGYKLWFNCNPDGPNHWFKLEWIDELERQDAVHIHFTMDDNPSLSEKVKAMYKRRWTGMFYDRYIKGLWVLAEGVIYSMFDAHKYVIDKVPNDVIIRKKWVGIDYGQANATVFILCGEGSDGIFYILDEYYHAGRDNEIQKSPAKYSKDYMKWLIKNGVDGVPVNREYVFIDPSAKGFMLQLHEEGENHVRQADNEVLKGIELVSSMIDMGLMRVLRHCKHTLREFGAYRWDPKAQERGEDKPIKQDDHCMDAIRYVINGTRMIWKARLKTRAEFLVNKLEVTKKNIA